MAEAGLFIGWGAPVKGREAKGLEVFNESVEYWGRLQQEGRIGIRGGPALSARRRPGGVRAPARKPRRLNDVGGDEESCA